MGFSGSGERRALLSAAGEDYLSKNKLKGRHVSTPIYARRFGLVCVIVVGVAASVGCDSKEEPPLEAMEPKAVVRELFQAMYDNDVDAAQTCVMPREDQAKLA